VNSRDSAFQNGDRFQVLTDFNGREDNDKYRHTRDRLFGLMFTWTYELEPECFYCVSNLDMQQCHLTTTILT
jgi:hypothetical protein